MNASAVNTASSPDQLFVELVKRNQADQLAALLGEISNQARLQGQSQALLQPLLRYVQEEFVLADKQVCRGRGKICVHDVLQTDGACGCVYTCSQLQSFNATALMYACWHNYSEVVGVLLAYGAPVDEPVD